MSLVSAGTDRALVVRSVSKTFGAVRALDDVDFAVRPGTVHALVGENGAGKSTLAKILAGIEPADAGAMTLGGAPYAPRDRAEGKGRGVNMVPQQLSLVGELSLVENLLLTGDARIARRHRARALLAETRDRAGVAVDLDVPTARLSQAHRQLGEIVVALAEGATTLILDEPTASLGPVEVGGLFAHLRALCDLGTAIVLITHRLDEVRAVADEVTVLSHGRRVHHGPARGLSAAEVARLMVGDLPEPAPRAPRAPGPVVLSLRDVEAPSDTDAALAGVSLGIRAGEIVGVAGVAGSGQNTLVEVLAGLRAPSAGTVEFDGHASPRAVDLLHGGLAWIPEERAEALVPTLSLGDTLALYDAARGARGARRSRNARGSRDAAPAGDARSRGTAPAGDARSRGTAPGLARHDAASAHTGHDAASAHTAHGTASDRGTASARRSGDVASDRLRAFDVRPPVAALAAGGLSGGNQQKLVAARELGRTWPGTGAPRAVIAYGPTQGLDLRAAQAIRDRLAAAAESGAAVLVASHDLDEIRALADRIVVLFSGRIVADLPAAEATTARVGAAMAGLHPTAEEAP